MNKMCYIYVLKCPITNEIRYVGKANNVRVRFNNHINRAKYGEVSWKNNWLRTLFEQNLKPILEIVEAVDYDNWKEAEIKYIKYYKDLGCNLTNSTEGGEGTTGLTHWRGKKHSDESRIKISKNHSKYWLGKHHSLETKNKLREKSKGSIGFIGKHTDEAKLRIKENNKRSKKVAQIGENNEIIAIYNTMSEAAINMCGKPHTSGIVKCINGKRNHCFNHKWKIVDEMVF